LEPVAVAVQVAVVVAVRVVFYLTLVYPLLPE
jgi:hypothetical protein